MRSGTCRHRGWIWLVYVSTYAHCLQDSRECVGFQRRTAEERKAKDNLFYMFYAHANLNVQTNGRLWQISKEGQKFVSHFTNKDQEQKEKFTSNFNRHAEGNKVHTKYDFFMSEPLRQSKLRKMLFSGNKMQSNSETTHGMGQTQDISLGHISVQTNGGRHGFITFKINPYRTKGGSNRKLTVRSNQIEPLNKMHVKRTAPDNGILETTTGDNFNINLTLSGSGNEILRDKTSNRISGIRPKFDVFRRHRNNHWNRLDSTNTISKSEGINNALNEQIFGKDTEFHTNAKRLPQRFVKEKRIHFCGFLRRMKSPIGTCVRRPKPLPIASAVNAYTYLLSKWPIHTMLGGGIG